MICVPALMLAACGSASADNTQNADQSADGFASQQAKRSYALGMDIGSSISGLPADLDVDALLQGVRDVLTGAQTRLTRQEMTLTLQQLLQDIKAAQASKARQQAQANLKASKAFLAENKTREGVKVTPSGLQYKVLEKGDGPQPDINDKVTVHYTGKLIDGTVFDSSRKRGEPVTFAVDAVIAGWTEALQMMHEGARYKLFIPPKLAYGTQGAGRQIGPNQALIFVVELIKVHQKKEGNSDAAGA